MVNLQEILDPLDIFRKYAGIRMQDVYNHMLKRGYTLGSRPMLRAMHGIIRVYHRSQVELLTQFWRNREPGLVVSLIPNFNRAIFEALAAADRAAHRPRTPLVTILTDFADFPPHFWMERQDQYFICGTEKAVEQAHALGHSNEKVFRTSGMIVRPNFYQPVTTNRADERVRLGLDPQLPTGLVLFGGQGSNHMVSIAERIAASNLKTQLILVCGRNQRLRERLKGLRLDIPIHVEGFTNEIQHFMHLSDFLIGKPGPGSISEAIVMNLPVIVERNAWTLSQERYNTEWVSENQAGIVLRSFRDIAQGMRTLLSGDHFDRLRANATRIQMRAVFEIPEILDRILQEQNQPGRSTRPR